MLYFSSFLLIFFSLWFSRKIHTLPNDPVQLQDLWGAKTALGQGCQRKGAIRLFGSVRVYKRKWSKWPLFITKLKEFKQFSWTICWVGGNTGLYTSVWGVVYNFSLSGWTLSKTFGPLKPGYPCSVDEELLLYPVSNSLLGRRCEWNADV